MTFIFVLLTLPHPPSGLQKTSGFGINNMLCTIPRIENIKHKVLKSKTFTVIVAFYKKRIQVGAS